MEAGTLSLRESVVELKLKPTSGEVGHFRILTRLETNFVVGSVPVFEYMSPGTPHWDEQSSKTPGAAGACVCGTRWGHRMPAHCS